MTSRKSKKNKAPLANGIRMQIDVSRGTGVTDFVAIAIPENKPGSVAPMELGISVTNKTSSTFPFLVYGGLIPELVAPNGQVLRPLEPTQRQFGTQRHHWSLIRPGGRGMGITLKARLSWQNNSLQLDIPTNPDYYWEPPITPENSWTFDALGLGTYQLRFTYESPSKEVLSLLPETNQLAEVEGIATAKLATSFVNLRLVEPVQGDKSAVEVDGIRFKTLVVKVLNIPKKELGSKAAVELAGIRITNNTPNPVRFSLYVTVIPEILGADGQILYRGYFSDWSRQAEESDFFLTMPGRNLTFFPKAGLWWQEDDQILLVIDARDGGAYTFKLTDSGTYKIQLNYVNKMRLVNVHDQETRNRKQIDNIWTGMVTTPFVELRLARP